MLLGSDLFISDIDSWLYFSLCRSANEFDAADDCKKKAHSEALLALRCITHTLPLACRSKLILHFAPYKRFLDTWNLDGWNDHSLKPARDAILDYYQVCLMYECSHSNPFYQTLSITSAMQSHPMSKRSCALVTLALPLRYHIFGTFTVDVFHNVLIQLFSGPSLVLDRHQSFMWYYYEHISTH